MIVCQICSNKTKFKSLCGCRVCLQCLIGQSNGQEKFSCPNISCSYQYHLTQVLCTKQSHKKLLQYTRNSQNENICRINNRQNSTISLAKDYVSDFINSLNECPNCGIKMKTDPLLFFSYTGCQVCKYLDCDQQLISHNYIQCRAKLGVFYGIAIYAILSLLNTLGMLSLNWIIPLISTNLMLSIILNCYFDIYERQTFAYQEVVYSVYFVYSAGYLIINYYLKTEFDDILKMSIFGIIYWSYFYPKIILFSTLSIGCYLQESNRLGIGIWMISHFLEFEDAFSLKIISYLWLILWNIFDIITFLSSQFICMVVIDLLIIFCYYVSWTKKQRV